VLNRLVRLSYWERIQSVLPEEFRQLLPPKPEVAALPAAEAGEDPEAAAADPEGHWAAQMVQRVRGKASPEALDAWMAEQVSPGAGAVQAGAGAGQAMVACGIACHLP
jgi:hypothetical protein